MEILEIPILLWVGLIVYIVVVLGPISGIYLQKIQILQEILLYIFTWDTDISILA